MKLLTRSQYSELVLARAGGACCVPDCGERAVDAHHILNRNLFTSPEEFGGYFHENGAQLCSDHHYQAELTKITPEELWSWCDVVPLYPAGWDTSKRYDTWGNEVVSEWERSPGATLPRRRFPEGDEARTNRLAVPAGIKLGEHSESV